MKDRFGLRELPKSAKDDFNFGRAFARVDTPKEFILPKRKVLNQGQTDKCTAFAGGLTSGHQELVDLDPHYIFAVSKNITGDPDDWGQNLKALHQALMKGAIETGKTDIQSRYLADYPDMYQEALKHAKKTYWRLSERDIKSFIYKYKTPVVIGLIWSWDLKEVYLSNIQDEGFGHAVSIIGFKEDYYVIQNSYGEEAGMKGIHYLHKDVAKHFIKRFGCYGMIDMEVETAREMNRRAEWQYANTFTRLLIRLRRLWNT